MYRNPLVDKDFVVPQNLVTRDFVLEPLTIDHFDLDYDAVMKSVDSKGNLDINPNHTLHQNLIDLGWHQKEFQKKSSFAYTVLVPSKDKCIGCVYIYPPDDKKYNVNVTFWIIKDAYKLGLYNKLKSHLTKWFREQWPFENICFE